MKVTEPSGGDAGAGATRPPWLYLVSAFLAMEPTDSLISISRDCGGGAITEDVQYFIWDQCISETNNPKLTDAVLNLDGSTTGGSPLLQTYGSLKQKPVFIKISNLDGKGHTPYLKSFLKKVIVEVESETGVVIDELYEQLPYYMTSLKGDDLAKVASRVIREISFLYPTDNVEDRVSQSPRKVVVPLNCSLNVLEGDTGCSIWPSSLFLSEFILSCPELFSMKSCVELGSGVGLVGICLAHVKPSKVVLSDGDLSTLAILKLNLELNHMNTKFGSTESLLEDPCKVKCLHLPWESAVESDLLDLMPDIVLGADVIYDPQCIPHLVDVIATLLTTKKSNSLHKEGSQVSIAPDDQLNSNSSNEYEEFVLASRTRPVAYIASVIRNINTYNYFHKVSQEANLRVVDITENVKIVNFLPYMLSYQRSSVRLLGIYQTIC